MKELEYDLAEAFLKRIYNRKLISESQYLSAYRCLQKRDREGKTDETHPKDTRAAANGKNDL